MACGSGSALDSVGLLSGSLDGAGGPAESFTIRRLVKCVLSIVSYEVVQALNQRTGGWESPNNARVWSAREPCGEMMEHGKVVFHSNVVDMRALARRFVIQESKDEIHGFDQTSYSKLLV